MNAGRQARESMDIDQQSKRMHSWERDNECCGMGG
jgi:hypothetical protein